MQHVVAYMDQDPAYSTATAGAAAGNHTLFVARDGIPILRIPQHSSRLFLHRLSAAKATSFGSGTIVPFAIPPPPPPAPACSSVLRSPNNFSVFWIYTLLYGTPLPIKCRSCCNIVLCLTYPHPLLLCGLRRVGHVKCVCSLRWWLNRSSR